MVCLRQRHQTNMTQKGGNLGNRDQERVFHYTSRTLSCVHHVRLKFQKIPRPQPVRGFWKILISGRTTVYIFLFPSKYSF